MGDTEVAADTVEDDGRGRPSWLAVATGLNAAIAVTYLACKPPESHTLSWTARLLISVLYILIACLAGTAGTWIALSRDRRQQFRSLVLWGARGWVFLPATMIFLRERSVWAPLVAVLAGALMAVYLSHSTDTMTRGFFKGVEACEEVGKSIFTAQVRVGPTSWVPFGVSLCLYGALMSAVTGRLAFVTLLLGGAAFLFVTQMMVVVLAKAGHEEDLDERSHPIPLLAIAFCFAFVALSVAAGTSGFALRVRAFYLPQAVASPRAAKRQSSGNHPAGGYQAIVLWPIQKKEKTIPSPPLGGDALSHRMARPWVIPFYGPYLYFKIPGETSGPDARTTHGDPLKVNVRSTDRYPLLMEAHQNLSDPVEMDCCREIQVVFRNDVSLGASEVGILLTDSHSKGEMTQNLGIKYVALGGTEQYSGNTSPVEETLSFPFPKGGRARKFDRITVVLFPDARHLTAGRKVAVERFIMIPK